MRKIFRKISKFMKISHIYFKNGGYGLSCRGFSYG
nr:MAG TPA: hypothetical protein [Caudoviricetes sp.]DAS37997.1 MAG TPA: hypothetical protein [Caudoviricetes sp.]